jgi:hypothetical protein
MRPARLFIVLAISTAACIDEPTRPDADEADAIDPLLALYVARSSGTIEIPPRPGASDVTVQGINALGDAVGRSGDVPVLWELTGSAFDVRTISELVGVLEIDDSGRILGHRDNRAAILENGEVTLIQPFSDHDKTTPGGLGNGGHAVGSSWTGEFSETARAFRWIDGVMTKLPPLPGDESSQGLAVNRSGTVAGVSRDLETERTMIVVWKNATPVSTGFEIPGHLMLGISDAGHVLISSDDGRRVVLWRDGVASSLPPPDGSRPHFATDISPGGTVLGYVEASTGEDRYGVWRGDDFFTISVSPLTSCWRVGDGGHIVCDSSNRDYPFYAVMGTRLGSRAVKDLTPTDASSTAITVTWTQVRDDRGDPARYRVKFARPPISWRNATIGCDRRGTEIGAPLSCTIRELEPGVSYDFQLMSYRRRSDGTWSGAVYSNVGVGQTND